MDRFPPLSIQYKQGTVSFYTGKEHHPPHKEGTMQAKEWQRGYNSAYFENLARVKQREKSA